MDPIFLAYKKLLQNSKDLNNMLPFPIYDPFVTTKQSSNYIMNTHEQFKIPQIPNEKCTDTTFIQKMRKHMTFSQTTLIKNVFKDLKQKFQNLKFTEEDEKISSNIKVNTQNLSNKMEFIKQSNNIQFTEAQKYVLNYLQLRNYDKNIPIIGDVRNKQMWDDLRLAMKSYTNQLFDLVMIDFPWKSFQKNAKRGVNLKYDLLKDTDILNLPIDKIQRDGILMLWIINSKRYLARRFLKKYGYKIIENVIWVKTTKAGKVLSGNGKRLRHSMEECWICAKGKIPERNVGYRPPNVIASPVTYQSQKPIEIYSIARSLVPDGYYLEIFARRNNRINGFVSVGNQP